MGSIIDTHISKPYILVYHIFNKTAGLSDFVKKEARRRHLKIVSINDKEPRSYADIQMNDCGPLQFLSLIYNAELVIADSFHATAFSLIFNKDFMIFNSSSNISRIRDLLEKVSLTDRLNSRTCKEINWENVNNTISRERMKSQLFLKNILK